MHDLSPGAVHLVAGPHRIEDDLEHLGTEPRLQQIFAEAEAAFRRAPPPDADSSALVTRNLSALESAVDAGQADWLNRFARAHSLHDVLFVDRGGVVVYSLAREEDLGENLLRGQMRDTPLAGAVRSVWSDPGRSRIFVSEPAPYGPSAEQQSRFTVVPIFQRGTYVGAIVAQQIISP